MKKLNYILLFLLSLHRTAVFSQTDPAIPFDFTYWNKFADEQKLNAKDREEFLQSHQLQHYKIIKQMAQPVISQKRIGGSVISGTAGPCVNADFELGNMNGWTRSCGYNPLYNVTGCCPNPNGQQLITSGAGTDLYGGFPVVCPGGNYSLRLGDNLVGGQADRIEQTFHVTTANANFSYKFAVVLEDPGHLPSQQPSFQIEFLDSTGTQIPCTYYYVAAGSGIPGFFNSGYQADVIYKPWSTVLINLNPLIGQDVTIRFSTFDCSLGGHFGYAYIDGVCDSYTGGGSDTICAGTSTTFCAPLGVSSYTWNGPGVSNVSSQCLTVTAQGIYTVQTTLVSGCPGPQFTYTLTLQNQPLANAGSNLTVCANSSSTGLVGLISGYPATPLWTSSGTGSFSSSGNLLTNYFPGASDISTGSVNVILNTNNNGVCPASSDTAVVIITPAPVVNAGGNATICSTGNYSMAASMSGTFSGIWSTSGSGSFSPGNTVINSVYIPGISDINSGTVSLLLTSANNANCAAVSNSCILTILHQPTVSILPNYTICSNTASVALSGTVIGFSNTGQWLSSGTGSFSNSNVLTNNYTLSVSDKTAAVLIFTLSSTNNGVCAADSKSVIISITPLATVNAGSNQNVCSSQNSVNLSGLISGASGTGSWACSGLGSYPGGNTLLNTSYSITPADISNGLLTFTLSSTNNGTCPAVSDTVMMRVTKQPTVLITSPSRTICSINTFIPFSGTITGVTNTGQWFTSGSGAFTNSNSVNTNYTVMPADIASGTIVFTLSSTNNNVCPADYKTITLSISPIATVNAGSNQNVCSSQNSVNLNGLVLGASGTGSWACNGLGAYLAGNTSLNTSYSITPADISNGLLTFTLTSTANGTCPAVSDTVMMRITKQPTVTVSSPSRTICSVNTFIALSGTITGITNTGQWFTSGSGAFTNSNSVNTNYSVMPADIASGTVVFTLSSTNNNVCPADYKTIALSISPIASVNAGNNQVLCSSQNSIHLNGSIAGITGSGIWSCNGTGTFVPNNSTLTVSYSISPADVNYGSVIFTLSSTNNGTCPAVSDTVKIKIIKLPSVNAGVNHLICSVQNTVALSGTVSGGTGAGHWNTTGTGIFLPNANSVGATYSLSPVDVSNGSILFTLTSVNSSPCPEFSDTLLMAIQPMATVNAGPNQILCSDAGSISLSGQVQGGTSSGVWSGSGSGTFIPGNTNLGVSYSLSTSDKNSGAVIFTLSSTNNGACPAGNDTVKMVVNKLALVNAGPSQSLCSTQNTIQLNGQISGVTSSGTWTTSGSGSFSGNHLLNPGYTVSAADFLTGKLFFVLTSTNNGVCPAVSDTTYLTINKKPLVTVNVDSILCEKQTSLKLNSAVVGGSGINQWASSGSGNFSPNSYTSTVAYYFSAQDKRNGGVTVSFSSQNNGACGNVTTSKSITLLPSPKAAFSASSYTLTLPANPVIFTNTSVKASSFSWLLGDGSTTTATNTEHSYSSAGFYEITLIAYNDDGCSDTTTQSIKAITAVKFPTAFTPKADNPGDGTYNANDYSNDVFFPFLSGTTEYHLLIFNRWGEMIFKSNDVNIGWNGFFNGNPCQQDTYVWKLEAVFFDGSRYNKTGTITLLR